MDRKLFIFNSFNEENIRVGVSKGIWALYPAESDRYEKKRETDALLNVDVGDFCLFGSKETGEYMALSRILEIPRSLEEIEPGEIWSGKNSWRHPFRLDLIGSMERRMSKKDLHVALPHVKFERWPFIPTKGLGQDDWVTILEIFGNLKNCQVQSLFQKIERIYKKEHKDEIDYLIEQSGIVGG